MTYTEAKESALKLLPLNIKNLQVDECTFVEDVSRTIQSLITLIDALIEKHRTSHNKKGVARIIIAYRDQLVKIIVACSYLE